MARARGWFAGMSANTGASSGSAGMCFSCSSRAARVSGPSPPAYSNRVGLGRGETYHARPGITFVPGSGVPATPLCVAWRADDPSPAVQRFVAVAKQAAGAVAARRPGPSVWTEAWRSLTDAILGEW